MNFEAPLKQQRHVTYKRREAKILRPIEETLMDELGLTYSDLVKKGCLLYTSPSPRDRG